MNPPAATPRWTVAAWEASSGLRHGFFGRAGGVSGGVYASLNCSARVGDDETAVRENQRRVARALSTDDVVVARQVHGAGIEVVASRSRAVGEADALVCGASGAVGVLTADCVPLLLVLPEAKLAAAVHAGWKGTALGIAAVAVARLCAESGRPASAVGAALGPSIDGCCYEVGEDVVATIEAGAGGGLLRPSRRVGGKSWIDLRETNAAILQQAGLLPSNIHRVGPCTRCTQDQCFSHRASGGLTGRQLSAIGWA